MANVRRPDSPVGLNPRDNQPAGLGAHPSVLRRACVYFAGRLARFAGLPLGLGSLSAGTFVATLRASSNGRGILRLPLRLGGDGSGSDSIRTGR